MECLRQMIWRSQRNGFATHAKDPSWGAGRITDDLDAGVP
jgi:hypothetical protein